MSVCLCVCLYLRLSLPCVFVSTSLPLLSVCQSVCMHTCQSVSLVCLSVRVYPYLSVCLSCLSVGPCVSISVSLSVRVYPYLSVCQSVCMHTCHCLSCLSVSPCVSIPVSLSVRVYPYMSVCLPCLSDFCVYVWLYLQFICSKYQFRSQTTDNSTGVEVLGDFGGPATARFCVPFRDFTQDFVRAAGVEGQGAARRPIHPYPPWVVEGARVELEVAGLRKSDNPLILQATARELINNQYNHCICVYTDGSVTTEGVGAAFVVPQLSNLTRKYQLPHVSIFTAELVAILIALNFFNDLCQPPMAVSGVFFLTRCRRCRPSNTTVSLLEKTSLKK